MDAFYPYIMAVTLTVVFMSANDLYAHNQENESVTTGMARLEHGHIHGFLSRYQGGRPPGTSGHLEPDTALATRFGNPLSYFKAVLQDRMEPSGLSSLENNLIVTEILDAARRSVQTGKTIKLH